MLTLMYVHFPPAYGKEDEYSSVDVNLSGSAFRSEPVARKQRARVDDVQEVGRRVLAQCSCGAGRRGGVDAAGRYEEQRYLTVVVTRRALMSASFEG